MVDLIFTFELQKHAMILMFIFCSPLLALKKEDCEVCFGVLEKFDTSLLSEKRSDHKIIEEEFKIFCKGRDSKETRFCYYVGAHEESPTGILGEISKRISSSLPTHKICERLKNIDSQICELRYEKMIDFKTVDLKKLKVRELKKILTTWDEICDGCIEKSDYIARIEELKPIYVKDEL